MSDLRVYGFSIEVKNQKGITEVKQFRAAVSDLDDTVAELNKTTGDNVKVTGQVVQTAKEVQVQSRMVIRQRERDIRTYKQLTDSIRNEISAVGVNKQQQEVLNNIRRLGVTATSEQKAEVVELTSRLQQLRNQEQDLVIAEQQRLQAITELNREQERQSRKTQDIITHYTNLNNTIRQYGNQAEAVNAIMRLGSNATQQQKQQVVNLVAEYQRLRNSGDGARNSMRNMRGVAQNLGWQLQDIAVQAQMGTSAFVIFAQQGSQFAAAFGATGALIGAGIAVAGAGLPALIKYLDDAKDSTEKLKTSQERLNDIFESGKYSVNGFNKELVELYKTDKQLAELKLLTAMLDAERVLKASQKQIKEYVSDLSDLGKGYRVFNSLQEEFDEDVTDLAKKFGITTDEVLRLNKAYRTISRGGSADDLVSTFKDIATTNPNVTDTFKELALQVAEAGLNSELARKQLEKLQKVLLGSELPTASKYTESLAERYERLRRQLTMTTRAVELDNFTRLEAVNLSQEESSLTRQKLIAYLDERDAIEARNAAIERSQALDEARIKQRESLLTPIAQDLTITSSNPVTAEIEKNKQTMDTLRAQLSQTKQYEYSERARINDLIEKEEQRHTDALFEAQLILASNQVSVIGSTAEFMSSLTDELFDGGEKVRAAMENMNAWQKAMFFTTRAVAAAEALINGISLGGKLAEMFPLAAPAMIAFGTGVGAANAGAIAGTTFAGAFDDGGYIPSGMTGIVSEYGDELVNGQLVQGPARVTSREDTAKMMNGGSLNVNVINNAPGVSHTVNQIDENTVEIIAAQYFEKNIDRGVAQSVARKGSQTDKSLRGNYPVTRKY